jgi:beta-galactosidase
LIVLAYYDHPFFSNYPAITINTFGKGTLLYQGSIFSDQIQAKIIKESLSRAGISNPDLQFTWPLIAKSGVNDNNKEVHFYYNYSSIERKFKYPHSAGKELITDRAIASGETLIIKPWDVIIIEEK